MTTFALVHGAWHNATCWHPTASVPRQPGHEVITMDLPCTDPAAGLEEYATTVLELFELFAEEVPTAVEHTRHGGVHLATQFVIRCAQIEKWYRRAAR